MDFPKVRRILSYTRRAVSDYNMINDGDRIAVGLSGGKDSLTLLCALDALSRFYEKKYELCAITLDMGFPDADFSLLGGFCEEMGIEYIVKKTELAKVIFEYRKEKNPCSLCARMRRGIINEAAVEAGANKVALGHHWDDVLDTFMLNLFHEGRIGSFSPVTYLDRTGITVIRPLIYAPEKDIRYFSSHSSLPVCKNPCPADKNTEREEMKQMLNTLDRGNKGLKHRMFGALQKSGIDGWGKGQNDITEQ